MSATLSPTDRELSSTPSQWLHRCAVLLVCLVWPLIWIGGLVTTYDAGMAVPDWPGTYGYNMFLYPIGTWLSGPFDLFIEHGHRLLASLVGLLTIYTLLVAIRTEPRRWIIGLTAATLVAVIAQGVLGGLRVVLDQRTLAMLHGCLGPAFFALCTTLAVVTSRWWWRVGEGEPGEAAARGRNSVGRNSVGRNSVGRGMVWAVGVLAVLCYLQLLLGAQLRHVQATTSPVGFSHIVTTHVATAGIVALVSVAVGVRLGRCDDLALSRPARGLIGLVALQIGLGLSTWVVNYGFPFGSDRWPWAARYVIQSKGFAESLIVTGHVAIGSLLIACSVMLWLRVLRRFRHGPIESAAGIKRVMI
ncbi:COX15/CtaA family protein [Candidatus Laterigemmans baculatus]|uniref:COX15/CtaA family protein n=1 Tax=Candidatus Laterigemmans baculatus TaxID=2770505 RepID=UPI0013DB795A|nr:COX15/CtaA family protein [Candidatus Laterigemmans baculatus]